MTSKPHRHDRGPFEASQLSPGDSYELSHGHPIYCAPTGGRGSRSNLLGASVVGWDPAVQDAGVDTGFAPERDLLRAPDVAVGNIPDEPGWVRGVPRLAIEYADTGQDESELADKIRDLLAAGTEHIWVVRLEGPRRVEVHTPGQPMHTVYPGQSVAAPGVLKNPVAVDALYDREAAREAVLANLLQAKGYESLQAVLDEGKKLGLDEGKKLGLDEAGLAMRNAIRDLCDVMGIDLTSEQQAALEAMDLAALDRLRASIKREHRWPA